MQLKTLFRSPAREADLASAQGASYVSSPTSIPRPRQGAQGAPE
jgi:hypothetical protein